MGRRGWSAALYAAGAIGLGLVVLLLTAVLLAKDLGTAADLSGVLSALLAVVPLAVALFVWHRRSIERAGASSVETVAQAKRELSAAVRERWSDEARRRDQDGQYPMPVVWRLTSRDDGHGQVFLAGASTYDEAQRQAAELADTFLGLPQRRLVVTGGAGVGKTTLCMQLMLSLLEPRADNEAAPVPVLVSASSWNPSYLSDFTMWIAIEVGRSYPQIAALGPDIPRRLTAGGHVLPVLDGLDELPDAARAMVVRTLGTLLTTQQPLILTCRTDEFAQAVQEDGSVLRTATVIEPEPLTAQAAAVHLRRHLATPLTTEWEILLSGLEAPGPRTGPLTIVAEAVTTPLDLGLLRATYAVGNKSPAELLQSGRFATPAALRGHLLDRLIPALLEQNPPSPGSPDQLRPRQSHDPDAVRRWLEYLSWCLARQASATSGPPEANGGRDLRWWDLAALTVSRQLLPIVQLIAWTAMLAIAGAAGGVLTHGTGENSPVAKAWGGGAVGLSLGVFGLYFANNALAAEPRYVRFIHNIRRARFRRRVFGGALLGCMGGSLCGLLASIVGAVWATVAQPPPAWSASVVSNLVYGLVMGAFTGMGVGFLLWADIALGENRSGTPLGSLRADRDAALLRLIGGVGTAGLLFALTLWQNPGVDDLAVGALIWVSIAICVGLFTGQRAWLAYTMTVIHAARNRDLPFRLMRFLDDADRLGLLRAVGPVYQFRHAEFQDHLAARRPVPEPSATVDPGDADTTWWRRNWPFVVGAVVGLTFAAWWESPIGPGSWLTGWQEHVLYLLAGGALLALTSLAATWLERRARAPRP
ncbi:NACHT domain-containing protein [Streptomyces sp. NPDC056462]|uniref:NACHT domain-containing protein n=1 Tax=Streptomyces sp. NPDC056462 TaxID=3345826 RepID=UPI003691C82A